MKNENAGVQKQFFFSRKWPANTKKASKSSVLQGGLFFLIVESGFPAAATFFFWRWILSTAAMSTMSPETEKSEKNRRQVPWRKSTLNGPLGLFFWRLVGEGLFPQSLDLGFRVPGSQSDVNLVLKLYGFRPKTKSQIKRGRTKKKRVKSRRWRVESSCSTLYKKTTKDYGTLLGSAGHLLEKPFFLITRCHHYFVGEARKNERKKRRKAESKKRNKRRNKKKEHMKKQEKRNGMFYTQIFLENLGPCLLNYPLALGHVRPWCGKKISESRVWAPFWSRCGQNSALSAFFFAAPARRATRARG